jgi:hypothetical protein
MNSLKITNFDVEPILDKLIHDEKEKETFRRWFLEEHLPTDEIRTTEDLFLRGIEDIFMNYFQHRLGSHHFSQIINKRIRIWFDEHRRELSKIGYNIIQVADRFIREIDDLIGEDDEDEGEFLYTDGISTRQVRFLVDIGGSSIIAWIEKLPEKKIVLTPEKYETQWGEIIGEIMIKNLEEDFKLMRVPEEAKEMLKNDFRTTIIAINFGMLNFNDSKTTLDKYFSMFQTQMVQLTATYRKKVKPEQQEERRYMTDAEIADIMNLPYNFSFPDVTDIAQLNVAKGLEKQLRQVMIEPKLITSLKEQIHIKFRKSKVPNDHKVGLIAAQTVGEQATQNGMNSFKHAGQTGDSGFDRIRAVVNMTKVPANPFVSICLKGNPTLREARYYASRIESTMISDVCEFSIGFDSSVAGTPALFGGRAEEGSGIVVDRYPREPWMDIFVKILGNSDRPMHRNTWLIRGTCNVDRMYQRRISMRDIARTIENKYRDVQVIISSLSIGVVEVWYHESYYTRSNKSNAKAATDEIRYLWLRDELIQGFNQLAVTNIPGYSDAVVKRFAISNYVDTIRKVGNAFNVQFNIDTFYRFNVPIEQTREMLAMKAETDVEKVVYNDDANFTVVTDMNRAAFQRNLNEVEVSKLEDLIKSEQITDGKIVIVLNQEEINDNLINIESIVEFFVKQSQLPRFKPVKVNIDKFNMIVEISSNPDFNVHTVSGMLIDDPSIDQEVKQNHIFKDGNLIITGISEAVGKKPIQDFVDSFHQAVSFSFERIGKTIEIRFSTNKIEPSILWKSMKNVIGSDGCSLSTVFTSERREQINLRHYINARGYSLYELANLPFVDLTGCISSHPPEMHKVFGIEVMRSFVYMELMANGGKAVAARHNSLIADTLSYMGIPTPLDKRGKEIMLAGPFARAAFQETFKTLAAASLEGAKDALTSSVSKTLVGEFEKQEKKKEDEEAEKYSAQLLKSTLDELVNAGKKFERKIPRKMIRKGRKPKEVKKEDPFGSMYDEDVL